MNQDEFARILQSCLDQIERGDETVDTALSHYPEIAESLRPHLEAAFWLITHRDALSPTQEFVDAARHRLFAQMHLEPQRNGQIRQAELTPASRPQTAKPTSVWQSWQALLNRNAAPFAYVFIILFFLYLGGSSILALTHASLPGDRLYPAKIAIERTMLAFSQDDARDAELSLQFTERRSREISRLVVQGRFDDVFASVVYFEDQVNLTLISLNTVADRNASQAHDMALTLSDMLEDQNRVFANLIEAAPGPSTPALMQAMQVSRSGVNNISEMLQSLPPIAGVRPTATRTTTPTSRPSATVTRIPRRTPTLAPTRSSASSDPSDPTPRPLSTASTQKPPTQKPTATGIFDITPTSAPSRTPASTPTPAPTSTSQPTPTPAPTATPIPTKTPLPTATSTPVPTNTPIPTATPTPVPTNTPVPTATPTPVPTNTPQPTDTPVPTPTATPPPTSTPEPTHTPNPTITPASTQTTVPMPTMTPEIPSDALPGIGSMASLWYRRSALNQE